MSNLTIFSSGTPTGGGSGLAHGLETIKNGGIYGVTLQDVDVICNNEDGGVWQICDQYRVRFSMLDAFEAEDYRHRIQQNGRKPDLIVLWGWIKFVKGLDKYPIINIHPAPLPKYGGKGYYGLVPHQRVLEDGLTHTAITVHRVNNVYDGGSILFEKSVPILSEDTPESLQNRVKQYEWYYYPRVIDLLLRNQIHLADSIPEFTAPA